MAEKPTTLPVRRQERSLRTRDPFDIFEDLHQEMGRIWGQMWPVFPRPVFRPFGRLPEISTWTPRVDAYEKDGKLIVKAELPGVKKEDVRLTLEDGVLVLEGERKTESEVKEEDYYRLERAYGSFHRRLALPFEVKSEHVHASFTDGVLEISIPKPEESKSKAEKIRVA